MKSNKLSKKKKTAKKDVINLDNEIIIGLTTKKTSQPKKNNSKKKTKKKKVMSKQAKKRLKILKWTSLVLLLIAIILIILFSDLFNIKQIEVINNQRVPTQEIINLSTLQTDENMFKTSKSKIKNSIKTNPYIEEVKISKKLNGTIILDVTERIPTYMIELDNGFAYMNNQGYILEISAIKLEVPTIRGFSTEIENIAPGNRLNVNDLKKLDTVIQIMKVAEDKEIASLINQIDISDSSNYILILESEKKTINFGDSSSINEKILWVEYTIQENKDVEGTLFVTNVNKPYFRSKV